MNPPWYVELIIIVATAGWLWSAWKGKLSLKYQTIERTENSTKFDVILMIYLLGLLVAWGLLLYHWLA